MARFRHSLIRSLFVAACVVAPLVVAPRARGDAADNAEAKRLYQSGTKHFALAEYEQAVADFKEGYRRKDDPVFLFNVAQAYRQMKGHEEDAIKFYRSYLRQAPDAANRDDVTRKIEALERAVAEQTKLRTSPPSAPMSNEEIVAKPPEKQPLYKKWWLWTAVGGVVVVGVGLGVGLGLGLSSNKSQTAFPPITY